MMDVKMETSPAYYDPENLSSREQYRRYGFINSKRHSTPARNRGGEAASSSNSKERSPLYDGQSMHSPTNAALLLENIKQEAESYEARSPSLLRSPSRKRLISEEEMEDSAWIKLESESIKVCKVEDEQLTDATETIFGLFASLIDSASQGLMSIADLLLRFEKSCRAISETIRYGSDVRQRVVEDKLMRRKVQLMLDEAATWSLMWHLYGKESEELPEELIVAPTTSHLEACDYVANDHTAQLCLRIVQWLEGLASKALDLESKVKGSHIGTYLPNSGVWHHTQRVLKKGNADSNTVHHLDFDAPTRENAYKLLDDEKQDESLLEDVWTLLRAGRVEEACELCLSGGQSWRAATLCPFGEMDLEPSVDAFVRNGKNRTLQAIELESGIGHQWRLWRWASYCASEKIAEQNGGKYEVAVYASLCGNLKCMLGICRDWESACWAMAKSWLSVLVDLNLLRLQPRSQELLDSIENGSLENSGASSSNSLMGPESWPIQVLNQQPRNFPSLLQKLHSCDLVDEAVNRECKEQHRQIEMDLMLGNIPHMLDLIRSWITPSEEDDHILRPYDDPQMMRFGAHAVLVLRQLLVDEITDPFKDKLMTVGDIIINMYALFLFSKQHEELVGIYASHLAKHRCVDLFVHMMEERLNSSVHVKYKLFLSAMEYLPFSAVDDSKGSFEEIIERVLYRSRESNIKLDDQSFDVAEQNNSLSHQKALVIQWLCFTPPSSIPNVKDVSAKLLMRALMHSNVLFREFALTSTRRVPTMPSGAHTLLSFLVEPLKQLSDIGEDLHNHVSQNLKEFHDWNEYYSCDATYRKFLQIHLENSSIPPEELTLEEKQISVSAAKESLEASLSLLSRKDNPWLVSIQDHEHDSNHPLFIELHATAMLFHPNGEVVLPEATVCATLASALYFSVTEDVVLHRQLMINVSTKAEETHCVEIVMRCLAVEGDGLGLHQIMDGGLLGNVVASAFKSELPRFKEGVTLEISRLDAWVSLADGSPLGPATYAVVGLCRRCCVPEIILRCMEVAMFLGKSGELESVDELIELVVNYAHLFSKPQLQEFLLFQREYEMLTMELQEVSL